MSRDKGILTAKRFREFAQQQMVVRVLIRQHNEEVLGLITEIQLIMFRAVQDKFFYGLEYTYEFPSSDCFKEGRITDISPSRIPWYEHPESSGKSLEDLRAMSEDERLERIVQRWSKMIPSWAKNTPHVACEEREYSNVFSEVALSDLRLFEAYGRLQTAMAYELRLDHAAIPNRVQMQQMINANRLEGAEVAIGNFTPWLPALHAGLGGFAARQRRQLTRSGINI